jgi:hypothetical protein
MYRQFLEQDLPLSQIALTSGFPEKYLLLYFSLFTTQET